MANSPQTGIFYGAGPVLGNDGPIPSQYLPNLHAGIRQAWQLSSNARFITAWCKTIGEMTNRPDLPPESYASALNRMRLNFAETSRNPSVIAELRNLTHLEGSAPEPAAALTLVLLGQTWLRAFLLQSSSRLIGGTIMHEAAHYAGAQNNFGAEFLLQTLDHASGLPR